MKTKILLRGVLFAGLLSLTVSVDAQILVDSSTGNVGIKLPSGTRPAYPLDVNGAGQFIGGAQIGNGAVGFYGDGTNHAVRAFNVANSGFYIQSYNPGNTSMYVGQMGLYAGRVGIGTVTPISTLHVSGVNPVFTLSNSSTTAGGNVSLNFQTFSGASFPAASISAIDNNSSSDLVFSTKIADASAMAERMRITNTGNVGIGTNLPTAKFTIQNGGSAPSANWLSNPNSFSSYYAELSQGAGDHVYGLASNNLGARHQIIFKKSGNTLASPSLVASGSLVGSLVGSGYDGTNFLDNASIDFTTSGTPAANNVPIDISFSTGANGKSERMRVTSNGYVGIGTSKPQEMLSVNGTIVARKIRVTTLSSDWPDYVFEESYKLRSLDRLETYINKYKHLPEVTSASGVQKKGLDLAATQAALLRKIEELTLYVIEQDKQIKELQLKLKK